MQLLVPCNFDAAYFCTPDSLRPSAVAKATAAELLTEAGLALQPELMIQLHNDAKDDDDNNSNSNKNKPSSWQTTLAIIWKHLEQQQQQQQPQQGDRILTWRRI